MLNDLGYVTLAFDMRGCGESEGEHGRVICLEQVEDTRNALTFLAQQDCVDPARIGAIGSSFGGAVAVYRAAWIARLAAVMSNGGWGDGERKFRGQHPGPQAWARFPDMLEGRPRAPRQDREIHDGASLRHRADPTPFARESRECDSMKSVPGGDRAEHVRLPRR